MRTPSGSSTAASLLAASDKENATHSFEVGPASASPSSSSSVPATADGPSLSPASRESLKRKRDEDNMRFNTELRRRRTADIARNGRRPHMTTESEWRRSIDRREATDPAGSSKLRSFTAGKATVSFQRRLARPARPAVVRIEQHPALIALGSDLPAVKDALRQQGPQLSAAVYAVRGAPITNLPSTIDALVPVEHLAHMPSHYFAIHARNDKTNGKPNITMFPAHAAVFSAYCANLHPLCPGAAIPDAPQDVAHLDVVIPVVPIRVPAPKAFGLLQHYLYSHSGDALAEALLPPTNAIVSASADRAQTTRHLAQQIAAVHSAAKINEYVLQCHGLWTNVVVLGVSDDGLWDLIMYFWDILTTALHIATLAQPNQSLFLGPVSPPLTIDTTRPTHSHQSSQSSEPSSSSAESDFEGHTSDSTQNTTPPTSPLLAKPEIPDAMELC